MNEFYLKGTAKLLEWGAIILYSIFCVIVGCFIGWLVWG